MRSSFLTSLCNRHWAPENKVAFQTCCRLSPCRCSQVDLSLLEKASSSLSVFWSSNYAGSNPGGQSLGVSNGLDDRDGGLGDGKAIEYVGTWGNATVGSNCGRDSSRVECVGIHVSFSARDSSAVRDGQLGWTHSYLRLLNIAGLSKMRSFHSWGDSEGASWVSDHIYSQASPSFS